MSKKRKAKRSKRRKKSSFFRRLIVVPLVFAAVVLTVAFIGGAVYFNGKALSYDLKLLKKVPQRTLVYDRSKKLLGHVSGHGENRVIIPIKEVSPNFIKALLSREDARFYQHGGVDYLGVLRAAITNIRAGGIEQGASTLTMQLARNTFGMREKSLMRKFQEVALAKRLERKFTKDEILEFYVNRIYFGAGLYGIEKASQGFFMKPASKLSPGEGAMLAGIIRGPSLLNPFRNIDDAKATRDEVLTRMVASDVITQQEAKTAKAEKIRLRPPGNRLATNTYALQTIHDILTDYLDPSDIERGGLRIYTTIDSNLQKAAEKSLDSHLTKIETKPGFAHPTRREHKKGDVQAATKYLQGAVVSIENATGGILAMVGGRDYGESPFNRAFNAKRQPGSTFKPLVYAVAIDRGGLLPGSYISDGEVRMSAGSGKTWSPRNSDGKYNGLQPAAIGLIQSRNTMSVRVGQIAGLENVRDLALALKFGEIPDSPVIFLGAFETTPMTITSAMSTLATKGQNREPHIIERIEHADGTILFQSEIRSLKIFSESVAWLTSDILGEAVDHGTGTAIRKAGYRAPCYGKTGTTNDYRDAWFVGYTDKITTGVWVGMDQPRRIMNRGYGSTLALPVWTEIMKKAETSGYKAARLPTPPKMRDVVLCRECGGIGSRRTIYPYQMQLPPDLMPSFKCRGHGVNIFTNKSRPPRAIPIPGEEGASPEPNEESDGFFSRLGRRIFGGK